jgi:hypothetical protein
MPVTSSNFASMYLYLYQLSTFLPFHMPLYLSAFLSFCLSVFLSFCLNVFMSLCFLDALLPFHFLLFALLVFWFFHFFCFIWGLLQYLQVVLLQYHHDPSCQFLHLHLVCSSVFQEYPLQVKYHKQIKVNSIFIYFICRKMAL